MKYVVYIILKNICLKNHEPGTKLRIVDKTVKKQLPMDNDAHTHS